MYPLSHLYVSLRVMETINPSLALGSILPDMLVGAGLEWDNAHRVFQNPLSAPEAASLPLMVGASLHGIGLPGLDYYSDISFEQGEGYAFQKAVFIEEDIANLGVNPDHAIWRGHNFVEMAIEIELHQNHQELWSYLDQASKDNRLLNEVNDLSKSLEAPRPHITPLVLERFLAIRGEKRTLTKDYADKLNQIYSLSIEPKEIEGIVNKAFSFIQEDYEDFLEKAIGKIKISLEQSPLAENY